MRASRDVMTEAGVGMPGKQLDVMGDEVCVAHVDEPCTMYLGQLAVRITELSGNEMTPFKQTMRFASDLRY